VIRLDDVAYRRFRDLIASRAGLAFPDQRRADLEAGVRRALVQSTHHDLDSYYALLADGVRGRAAFERLLRHLTVGETYFFRNREQFDALQQQILPQLIASNRASRRLRIWAAGCASGEEPYSVAMVLRELLPDVDTWTILILGTDINEEQLRTAERACYGKWSFRGCPPGIQARYFTQHGAEFHLRPEIGTMVSFAHHNLIEGPYPPLAGGPEGMDLILCRNVTIYFDSHTTQQVVSRFYDALVEGGWLLVGHAEPSLEIYRRFQIRTFPNAMAYQKVTTQPSVPAPHLPWTPPDETPRRNSFADPAPRMDAGHQGPLPGATVAGAASATAEEAYRQAREHADHGRLEDAHAVIADMLAIDPLQARAHYLRGLVYQEQARWEVSVEAFRSAIFLDPEFVLAYVVLADVAMHAGNNRQARKCLEVAHRLLRARPREEPIPDGEGVTVGQLLDAVAMKLNHR